MVGKTATKSTASTIVVPICILGLDNHLPRSIRRLMVFMEFNAVFKNVLRLPISQSVEKLVDDDISECLQSLSV
jgi:hypothetical protein